MRRGMRMAGGTVALLASLVLLQVQHAAGATYGKLWGKRGELWDPKGPLPDFSFAGYKQGNTPVPTPPVTRNVRDFKKPGMTDMQMIQAALAWAHRRPVTNDHVVLFIPAGRYTLTQRLFIKRSRLVLRGAGSGKTVFYIPKSLRDIYGPNPANPGRGAYVNTDGFVGIRGSSRRGLQVATVNKAAAKGDTWVRVDNVSSIQPGLYYDFWFTDVAGKFNDLMFNNKWTAPAKYKGSTRVKFTTKVLAKSGNLLKLERYLPYDIRSKLNVVKVYEEPATVTDSGVEGITFSFRWSWYAGHHLEVGFNAVEVSDARDCWVRDIASINADSTVLINGASQISVDGVKISVSKTRANNFPNKYDEPADADGHWGIQHTHSFDCLMQHFETTCSLLHDVGTGSSGKFSVYMNGKMKDGNLDLHRALAGPTLYTNIDAGLGTDALHSGGPPASGPNALAGTTWWNIKTKRATDPNDSDKRPGDCSFGPVINIVNVNLIPALARKMCGTWHYERSVGSPANLYEAQYALRMARKAAAAQTGAQLAG